MTRRRVLVLSTVHHSDDTRIREKLIRSLSGNFAITYATRYPRPQDTEGVTWIGLRGGRVWRNLSAWRHALFDRYDILSLHDPETLPAGIAARVLRRKQVVFDVHEDVPAQIRTKPWLPRPLRRPAAWSARRLLRLAERVHAITLAEPGYRRLFRRDHPVFPNHLDPDRLPEPRENRTRRAVYVGDITEARGVRDAVAACGKAAIDLHLVGAVSPEERAALEGVARTCDTTVIHHGRLPHPLAMAVAADATVGLSPLRDHPNYRDALPTKVLEYLALGVPVVASDLPGTRTALDGLDAVWLVPPGDVDALAAAIAEAADGDAVASALHQAASVRDRFQWPADDVLGFYRKLG